MQQNYEYIYAVYTAGSIKNASIKLNVTQPAISIAIKKTEDELGTLLFDRSVHPFRLTPAGEVVLRRIREIKKTEELLHLELQDLNDLNNGSLHLAATSYFSNTVLPPLLYQFMAKYQGIEVTLDELGTEKIPDAVKNGSVDAALYPKCEDEAFFQIPVYHDSLLFAIPNRFLSEEIINREELVFLNYKRLDFIPTLTNLELLRSIPLITLKESSWSRNRLEQLFREEQIEIKSCMQADQTQTAHRLACAGIAATLTTMELARETVNSSDYANNITFFRYGSPLMHRVICVTAKREGYVSNTTKKFREIAKKFIK